MKKNVSFREWSVIARVAGFEMCSGAEHCPERVGRCKVTRNFEDVTLGQIIQLSGIKDEADVIQRVVGVMTGMSARDIGRARAVDVVLYAAWVAEQVEKVNKLFAKLRPSYTAEEKQAGVESLNFGLFGMVDAYARRMGIQDHEQVMRTPWMVVYKCLEIDYKTNQFERRLNRIAADKMKRRR